LADDLQRYLSGHPVEARPDHLTYRLTKLVLRHKAGTALAATAAVLAAAVVGYALIPSPGAGPGFGHGDRGR